MSFARTESQSLLADLAGRLFADHNGFEQRRGRLSGPAPQRLALWPVLAEQGVLGAAIPETAGGFGGSLRDLAVVQEQVGRSLVVEPVLAAAIGGRMLLEAGGHDDAVADIIAGDCVISFAHMETADPFTPPATQARADGNAHRLHGRKVAVRHADLAHRHIVTAMLDGQASCFLVDADASGLARDDLRLIDASSAATLHLNDTPASHLGGPAMLARALDWYLAGLAAETAGIIAALNEKTFAYLGVRRQFGVALASFQALQHRAASMFAAAEESRALVDSTIEMVDAGSPSASRLVSAAKALSDDAGRRVAHEAAQLHGGMGVSDELDISHYLRRLAAIRAELGGAETHRRRFAALSTDDGLLLDEGPALAAFRDEVRSFVRANVPPALALKGQQGLEYDKADFVAWQGLLHRHGWFAAAWPVEHGGVGWDLERQLTFLQEAALNDAPFIVPYGVNMVGPVLYTFGTPAQRSRHLPGILSSEVWWCQGYSEPNAGSDLASLKTTAVRDGDDYIVNGTKMWTTEAHWADWMHCLVRTDRTVKAQRGISFLLIDMRSPGITVRPIVTIDGQHHTNQVFLDDVRVPAENLVGAEGQGWSIAKFLLSNERVAIADTGPKLRLLTDLRRRLHAATQSGMLDQAAAQSLEVQIADAAIQLSALCALEKTYVRAWAHGAASDGPQASVLKIRGTEILQLMSELALQIAGPMSAVHDPADLHAEPTEEPTQAIEASVAAHRYLYGRCWSIFGGTNEIQRGIIARAVLPAG